MQWRFNVKRPSDKTRDPVVGEFFASDAIKSAGEALVREGIQNALDARSETNPDGAVRVRIYLSGDEAALSPSQHGRWFEGAWPHYLAPGNGLRTGDIRPDSACPFLVFEDLGTTGLVGDQQQHQEVPGAKNPFFYFFRAEAKTAKQGEDRGRWGVGKQAFPRASLGQSFFGYSETGSGGFLMGGCILKHHAVGGEVYTPDGSFAEMLPISGDSLPVPVTDPAVLEQFRRDFRIHRTPGTHGLSIVVPWLDNRGEAGEPLPFDRSLLALAVLEGYFIPVLEGRLEVTVEDATGALRISATTFEAVTQQLQAILPSRAGDLRRLAGLVRLASAAKGGTTVDVRLGAGQPNKAAWTDDMLGPDVAANVRELLKEGRVVRVSAEVPVRERDKPATQALVHCYLARAVGVNERPCHVREDLIISKVDARRVTDHFAVVRVDTGPLATLLGDAENPAHTEWQPSSRNFKDKYIYGGLVIQFVSGFASEVLRRVYAASKNLDRGILLHLFSDPGPTGDPVERQSDGNRKDKTQAEPNRPVLPKPQPASYRIGQSECGFTVSGSGAGLPIGTVLTVTAAYETAKGGPFASYSPLDFQFSDENFEFEEVGCHTISRGKNKLEVHIDAPQFRLGVDGFDINRDVVIRVQKQLPTTEAAEASMVAEDVDDVETYGNETAEIP